MLDGRLARCLTNKSASTSGARGRSDDFRAKPLRDSRFARNATWPHRRRLNAAIDPRARSPHLAQLGDRFPEAPRD